MAPCYSLELCIQMGISFLFSFAFSFSFNIKIQLIIFFAAKDGEALYSQQKQDWELTVAQIMNSLLPNSDLKKVGKTTRPFMYDLHQIPYTVEVRNRFKGLDVIDRVPDELWMEVHDIL